MENVEQGLIDSFNKSAGDYRRGSLLPVIFAKKYDALANYKATTAETRTALAHALFDVAEQALKAVASPNGRLDTNSNNFVDQVSPLLKSLAAPESLPYVPERAPQALADLAISLADRVGSVTPKEVKEVNRNEYVMDDYRKQMTGLSELIMHYADLFSKAIEDRKNAAPRSPATSPHKLVHNFITLILFGFFSLSLT